MYKCSTCGSEDPDHVCPGPDVKTDGGPPEDLRAAELRRPDETKKAWRLRRILEMEEEGLTDDDIGEELKISTMSVRSIKAKHRATTREAMDEERRTLSSSLATSLTNHTPDDDQVLQIEMIRKAADELCVIIDALCPSGREGSLAKTHLDLTVMWAVKSIVLPKKAEGGASPTASILSVDMR